MRSVEVLVTEPDIGIDRATGEYLMFLAAGNELDVHAARACVAAAMDTGAELVAGRWEVARGQQDPAVLEMFRHTVLVGSIEDRPDLRGDRALSNKLFATALLRRARLRVVDGDVAAFTAQAYTAANGIALIPQRLYVDHLSSAAPSADDARVAAVEARGSQLVVRGSAPVPVADHADDAGTTFALVVAPAGTDREVAVPVTVVDRTSAVVHWECTLDLPSVVRPTWRGYRSWGLRLATATDTQRTLHRMWVEDVAGVDRLTLLRRSRWLPAGTVLRTHVNARGNLMLRLAAEGTVGRRVARVTQPAFSLAQRRPGRRAVGPARPGGTPPLPGPGAKGAVSRAAPT